MANMNITKRAIQTAFLGLLKERTLGKITVKDISDRCGINRNTFYYHYQDIPALLEEICANSVTEIINEHPSLSSVEDCLEAIMEKVLKDKRLVMHVYGSENRGIYEASLWRICEYTIKSYAEAAFPDTGISDEDKALFIRFYKCELFGLTIDWITTGMKDDYARGVLRYAKLRRGMAEELIERMKNTAQAEEVQGKR